MEVYVIIAERGEYETESKWIEDIYADEQEAERVAQELQDGRYEPITYYVQPYTVKGYPVVSHTTKGNT